MAIPGLQQINVGLPNESANSDSLYTAFTKTKDNFANIFANAGPVPVAGNGITVSNVSNVITVSANLVAGNNIVLTNSSGAIIIDAVTGGPSGSITGVLPGTGLTGGGYSGNVTLGLSTSGVVAASYTNPTITIDATGRITNASNNTIAGTVTSVGLVGGSGITISGGPVTSSGLITVTNAGVTRLTAGTGISLSSSNGNVTVSANTTSGTVTSVGITSSQLIVTSSPVVTSGTITVNLPANATFAGNVTAGNVTTGNVTAGNVFANSGNIKANVILANSGNINGDLVITGNISPATATKVGGIKAGPGANVSVDGTLTIDTANIPLSFGNFTASNNVLQIDSIDQDMILRTQGNAEIQLVGNIGFYKPDGLPPNVANRYFSATDDGQISIFVPNVDPFGGALKVIGSTTGDYYPPVNTGVMLHITGQDSIPSRFYNDGIGSFAAFVGRRINGNVDVPTAVQAGDELIRISSTGYNGTAIPGGGSARIVYQAMENYTVANAGSNLSFWTTAIGSNTLSKIVTIDNANGLNATKIVSTGNISAVNFVGVFANGTSNVSINGNVNISAAGNANILVATGTGVNVAGTLNATGNANVGNIGATNANITAMTATGNINVGNLVIPTGNIIYTPRYGAFYSNVDQTNPVANTAMAVTFNNTRSANGVSIVSSSQITIAKTGVYNIVINAQVQKTGGGTSIVDMWLNKNGTPVDWTTNYVTVTTSTPQVPTRVYTENVTVANTYYEIMWSSPDTSVTLESSAANTSPTRPGIPSAVITVIPVGA